MLEEPASIIVTTPIGLLQQISSPEAIRKQVSYLKVGDTVDRDFLIEWLVESDLSGCQLWKRSVSSVPVAALSMSFPWRLMLPTGLNSQTIRSTLSGSLKFYPSYRSGN